MPAFIAILTRSSIFIDLRARREGRKERERKGEGRERERDGGRERNFDVREKLLSIASHMHPTRVATPKPRSLP